MACTRDLAGLRLVPFHNVLSLANPVACPHPKNLQWLQPAHPVELGHTLGFHDPGPVYQRRGAVRDLH